MGGSKKKRSKAQGEFEESLKSLGLCEDTSHVLWEHGFCEIESLKLLVGEEEALKEIPISMAQGLKLKKAISSLAKDTSHVCAAVPESSQVPHHPEASIATPEVPPATLRQVLCEMGKKSPNRTSGTSSETAGTLSHVSGGCDAIPSDARGSILSPAAVDPQVYLRGGSDVMTLPGVVAYDIVDFINLVPPIVEEEVISEHGSAQIIHRTATRKPKITEVSVEEWCLANTRIMDLLVAKCPQMLKDYVVHAMKVCELCKYY